MEVEILETPPCGLGEGPFWDPDRARLSWVDIETSRLLCMDDSANVTSNSVAVSALTAAFPVEPGWMLVMDHGFGFLSDSDVLTTLAQPEVEHGPQLRMNDAACDANGRLWAGSTSSSGTDAIGSLFRMDLDGAVSRIFTGLTVSNGMGWSPDGKDFYLIDSIPGQLWTWRFDPDDGVLSARHLLVSDMGPALPDGMAVDEEGCLWVAFFGGSQVRRFSPEGNLMGEIRLPLTFPTSVCFGGPRLDQLYVTTAQRQNGEQRAGQLLVIDVGVAGLPAASYAGVIADGAAR